MTFNGLEITQEIILKTRKHFMDNAQKCIEQAVSGETYVNDLEKYVAWREKSIENYKSGGSDHTFTFMQYAHYLQTGNSVALLP